MPGSARLSLKLGYLKASGPDSPLSSAGSKMRNKREPTSSRPTLSSSTESTSYAKPSNPNKPAHIASTLRQEHSNPTANHAAAEPRAFL
jgi:hypothetical protein